MGDIHVIEVPERPTLGIRQVVRMSEIRTVFDTGFTRVLAVAQASGATLAGAPYARYRGMPGETVDVEVGFPLEDAVPVDDPAVFPGSQPAARVAEVVHTGDYDTLPGTYERLLAWVAEQGMHPVEDFWEFYEAGPESDADPSTWRTRVLVPVTGPELTR
ncbi:GyrI-like domain-containing protein [Georgenia sp. 10Sc9-8]|uniref:GyrI-like domain-containing protein n=1 Tax=Georgenia halotolerans TaxID=3028317 RepID=A0ABT5TXZ2_9MICO|nr:GyrI-like domain-containing protein [Georgenia halotolerans]